MGTISFLILFPLIIALILLFVKSDKTRKPIVIIGAAVIAIFSIILVAENFSKGSLFFFPHEGTTELLSLGFGDSKLSLIKGDAGLASEILSYAMIAIEAVLCLLIVVLGIKYKKYLASILAIIQTPLLIYFEVTKGHEISIENNFYIDKFSMIMVLIIGIIGSLITVYALGYMKDFAHHLKEGEKDRNPLFFFLMFLFLAAMFGIVLSNNIVWMYFFWEITTLCSFFLIGFTKTQEAINNSFRALIMNLLGGLAFCIAILFMGNYFDFLEFSALLDMGAQGVAAGQANPVIALVVALLAFAGLTKAAQMPFNSWLLGAMVAPTPTSALLHSSTMVKAGVFMIVKLAPLLGASSILDIGPGFMVMLVGGVTFLLASFAAVSQSNAKRVLAYSTVANLGLICACAGTGTPEGTWAAIMLIVFHAVTKSLLFLCVGTAEHNVGSRDIEDFDGLFGRMPKLATFMIIGISAMYLAPFGMLISKWAALKSFVDAGNVWLILIIVFGSAVTLFYWTKWLGKMVAIVANRTNIEEKVNKSEWFTLTSLIGLIIVITLIFPLLSSTFVVPFIEGVYAPFGTLVSAAIAEDNMIILVVMVAFILVLPLLFYGKTNKRVVDLYMAGVNKGDNLTFIGSMGQEEEVRLRNWYMDDVFNEKRVNRIGLIVTCVIFTLTFSYMLGMGITLYKMITGGAL
ncbi:MAG: NADH-quinone oxidoreductase subunit L [Clostridiales Family XIII bacterium]|nr:NADH-quinone oxidoreductase subunit L [Clostridiales Family XIII bacterium]